MRSGLLTLICTVMLVCNASAQDQANRTKYELIRETINFLAKDKTVSQDTNFRITCETLDYDCFAQQLSAKPIVGIERWYNRWRSMTATDTTGLVAVRDRIFADIFERRGKDYRKKLIGYESYVSRTQQLIDQYPDGVPLEETAVVDTDMATSDSLTSLYPTEPEQPTLENKNPEKDNPMIAYLALALGIIALIIAVLPMLKKKEEQLPADFQSLADRIDELSFRMKRLERQVAGSQSKEAVATLTEIMESVEKRVVDLEIRSK